MQKTKTLLFTGAIALVSACAIALELALMRYMLIAYWHHLYYLVISAALLGFGASGTFLSLARSWIQPRYRSACWLFALLFAVAATASFHVLSLIPLNMMHLAWNPGQIGYLLLQYVTLFVPFFFAACCLGTALTAKVCVIGRLYAANMIGSGLGAAAGIVLMYLFAGEWLAVVIGAILFMGSALLAVNRRQLILTATGMFATLILLAVLSPPQQIVSQYKALSYYHQLGDARTLARRRGPLGRIDVISSDQIHLLPGRSLTGTTPIPRQAAMVVDGDSVSAITAFTDPTELAAFDETTLALPYHLLERPATLIVGAGGGFDIGLALHHQCSKIIALELNSQVIDLMRSVLAEHAGDIYSRDTVEVVQAEARGFLRQRSERFDLIQIPPLDSFSSAAAGVHALNESYLYTVEALQLYLQRLKPNGILCLTRWLRYWPERDGIKLLATAIEAMEHEGLSDIDHHLIAIRNWRTITVLVSPSVFTAEQIAAAVEFCEKQQSDVVHYPGITAQEANKHHVLCRSTGEGIGEPEAVYFDSAQQMLDPTRREDFYANHLCNVRPATDDRPYFHDFFRVVSLKTLRQLLGDNWMPFVDWGYLILVAALIQSCVLAALCIMLPLLWLRPKVAVKRCRLGTLAYFGGIGLAYMLMEISFIQRLALFLSHPVATVAVVLAGFLCFSGLGSYVSQRWSHQPGPAIMTAGVGICLIGVIYLLWWDQIIAVFQPASWPLRCIIALALQGPLAFLMGIPFPLGLQRLSEHAASLTPWAWGVNCFASVIAASLAVCIATSYGHSTVLLLAMGLYLTVAISSGIRYMRPLAPVTA